MAKKTTPKSMPDTCSCDDCSCGPGCGCGERVNPFVGIAGALGGTLMIAIVVTALAAESSLSVMVPIAWAFVVLGIALGLMARRKQ